MPDQRWINNTFTNSGDIKVKVIAESASATDSKIPSEAVYVLSHFLIENKDFGTYLSHKSTRLKTS